VLSSTAPAHRMCQTIIIAFTFRDAGLHADEGSSALKHRACAQNMLDITYGFQIWDAGVHAYQGSGGLKYGACAQNVLDVAHRFYILE
jgi:hypothetical protein